MFGLVFAVLIVCALVFGTVLPVLVDRFNQPQPLAPPTLAPEEPSAYEGELRAAIEAQPDNPQPMVSLANLLVAQGNGAEAIQWYERAVELDPDRLQTRLDFGYALASRASYADAEVQYRRAIAIDDESADAHYLLGELYLDWRPPRLDEARREFERAIEVQPDSVAASQAAEALAELERRQGTPAASPAAATQPVPNATPEDDE